MKRKRSRETNLINRILSLQLILLSAILISAKATAQVKVLASVRSPDHKTLAEFGVSKDRQLFYRLYQQENAVLNWSRLGIRGEGIDLTDEVTFTAAKPKRTTTNFAWPLGESDRILVDYNSIVLHGMSRHVRYEIPVRIFNGSLAFRYLTRFPGQQKRLKEELTEFNFSSRSFIYQYHEESVFRKTDIDSFSGTCDQPATVTGSNGHFISIGEADNRNYSKCVLVAGKQSQSLKYQFYTDTVYRAGKVMAIKKDSLLTFRDSMQTPWRTVSVCNSATGLHEFSQLYLKLVTPEPYSKPDGIKPGKVFRVPISTDGAMEGVDFASRMNFQYILLDAGWYGAEFRTTSDPTKPIPELDLPGILSHAKSKGIGVILYVNYVGLKTKLDTILPLYKRWGVSGLKFGFVDGGTQAGLSWLDDAVSKVNRYGFILNIHDHFKPTGASRRYPVLLSQEGIRGNENSPDAYHNMVLPYTRFLAGAADFTFCFPNAKNNFSKNLKVSKGQQIALTVIYFDPLQAIFWYGKASDYQNEKELEFFKQVPTVWDHSKYVAGTIGENISVVRKKGSNWYLGSAAGFKDWDTTIILDFLDKDKTYKATIFSDDNSGGISQREVLVNSSSTYRIKIAAKGGQAIIFTSAGVNQK